MPERRAAIIAALIVDRPLCITCLATKGGMTESEAQAALDAIRANTRVFSASAERCDACGVVGPVVSLSRPA